MKVSNQPSYNRRTPPPPPPAPCVPSPGASGTTKTTPFSHGSIPVRLSRSSPLSTVVAGSVHDGQVQNCNLKKPYANTHTCLCIHTYHHRLLPHQPPEMPPCARPQRKSFTRTRLSNLLSCDTRVEIVGGQRSSTHHLWNECATPVGKPPPLVCPPVQPLPSPPHARTAPQRRCGTGWCPWCCRCCWAGEACCSRSSPASGWSSSTIFRWDGGGVWGHRSRCQTRCAASPVGDCDGLRLDIPLLLVVHS